MNNLLKLQNNELQIPDHYLTFEQMDTIKTILNNEYNRLKEETEGFMNSMSNYHSDKGDQIDRANKETTVDIESKLAQRDMDILVKVKDALQRIDNDEEFGYCDCCGEEIGFKRLTIRPFTKECLDCKSFKELELMRDQRTFK